MELLHIEVEKILKGIVSNIFGKDFENLEVQYSGKKGMGDLQTNFALISAKKLKMKPIEIGKLITDHFNGNIEAHGQGIIERIVMTDPGFLNIFIKSDRIFSRLRKTGKEKYRFPYDTDKKVLIDYSSPNIAKRMHIGHLRSTIIGDSLKRIMKYMGFTVLGDNHLGDWGSRFGKLIIGYRKWMDREEYRNNPVGELERVYVEFSEESHFDPELEILASKEWEKLEAGEQESIKLWKKFLSDSLDEYNKVYSRLDVTFDMFNGESFYKEMMPELLEILKEKGIATESEELLEVNFGSKEKLRSCIVRKKDGNFHLYSTIDLATLKYRKDVLDIDRCIYVADERQKEHFRQVFRIAEMLGSPYDYEKVHVWYGIMRFEEGEEPVPRRGGQLRLLDILEQAEEEAEKIVHMREPLLEEKEKRRIARIVGIGAVKYFNLSQNRISPISFSWDRIMSLEGNTALYLQYTYARIISVFKKLDESGIDYDREYERMPHDISGSGRELSVLLLKYPYAVMKACEGYKPNIISDYLFEAAKTFNGFYASDSILKETCSEKLNMKLLLAEKTAFILKEGLYLLGIEVVERI